MEFIILRIVVVIVALIVARALLENKVIGVIAGVILGCFAFILAKAFPDFDQLFKEGLWQLVISHRSMLTHNALICWIIALLSYPLLGKIAGGLTTFGAIAGTVLHLGADMFPQSWHGYAFIYIPIIGNLAWIKSVAVVFSFSWLLINILFAILSLSVFGKEE